MAAISAHGTGTLHNDRAELAAFQGVFGEPCRPFIPLREPWGIPSGPRGHRGVHSAPLPRREARPPTVGFGEGEEQAAAHDTTKLEPLSGTRVLATNSGFGGVSCALILKAGST